MFSALQNVLQKISVSAVNKDESKDIWIKIILELFSEIHQIDHNANKIFAWLLSECQSLYDDKEDNEQNKVEIYLNAILSTLKIAIDRKQEVKGLEVLLNDICLSIITSIQLNNDNLFEISMKIIEYLCKYTNEVWNVCAEFAIFQLNKYKNNTSDDQQIFVFKQLSQFILMLLNSTQNLSQSNAKNIIQWISNIHSLCCSVIWNNNYLKILCKTIFFNIYTNHGIYKFIDEQLLYQFSKTLLLSIDEQKSKLEMEHFLIIQWIADIIFINKDEQKRNDNDDSNDFINIAATQYRKCIMHGLKYQIKVIEKISIQLLQKYHKFILFPQQLPKECIDSIIVLWNCLYEVRASTISNMLKSQLPKLLQLLSDHINISISNTFDAINWIQSIFHIIWQKGLEHRNKAVRRATLYCLLSWDFHKNNKITPFHQSFILNEFLVLMNHPLWFRRSYYDITRNKNNDNNKYTPRPKANWQNSTGKAEEALSTKSPPEGFGFLIESFLTNYLFKFVNDSFAKQIFLSEFIVSISCKVTSFYSLYHMFGFMAIINKHNNEEIYFINAQNIKSLQMMMTNLVPKFGPLYRKKLVPLISQVISMYIHPKTEFYAVCKLIDAIPNLYMSPSIDNEGFLCLRNNLNKYDWIGKQLLILIRGWIEKHNDSMKIPIIANILQFVECNESFQDIINIIFEVVSVSYSQPYQSQTTVTFCMQLLTFIIKLTEYYPDVFAKHRKLLKQIMIKSMNEILSYIFDQQLMNADFSDIHNDKNWIVNLSIYVIRYYGDIRAVQSFMTTKLKIILSYIHSKEEYYVLQDFPSLFILSYCMKYRYQFTKKIVQNIQNDERIQDGLVILWMSIRLNPNLNKTYGDTLKTVQFDGMLGVLSEKNTCLSKEIARKVIQFAVDALDAAQGQIKSIILECINLSLPFANLSVSNLKVLSDAAWYVLSDIGSNTLSSIPDTFCVDLLLFPVLFNDKNLHSKPDGHIRQQLMRAFESKKSAVLQPMISHAFLLWHQYPDIGELYIDNIVRMCHTIYHEKILDPEDRINRDEYLFGVLLMFLSIIFQERSEEYKSFKSIFIDKLFTMIDKQCELPYLDIVHQRTWNIFWHISPFITNQYGFHHENINNILDFLCNLCYNNDRSISSNQRQWITLSIIRIIVASPKYVNYLYKKHKIIGRKPNTHVWLMYALGDTASKLVFKYKLESNTNSNTISKEFLCDTLQEIISILAPYLCNNYGLVRTTSQYFFHQCIKNLISINPQYKLDIIIMQLFKELDETPDSIKLRKRLKGCYQWLEKCNMENVENVENVYEIEEKKDDEIHDIISENVLDKQLKISRQRTYKQTELLQNKIIKTISRQHPILSNNKRIDEIIWLIKNRVSLVGFTDQLSEALSNVLLSTFEYYAGSKPKINDKDDNDDEQKQLIGYQRKLDPLIIEYNNLVKAEELKLDKDIKTNRRKCFGDIIVVTSLLEKATNLGGISRTCEIFGVKQMIVHDKKLLKRDDFKKLSVTSEDWLPIKAVPRNILIEYLRKEKEINKYFIIGLEQTTNSVGLENMEFSGIKSKCMIVIGREKTGLPPDIINECDICIEIPQFGVIRSLNAHVSFAITLWEYVRQQLHQKSSYRNK